MEQWQEHFKNYDRFMNQFSDYKNTLNFHMNELRGKHHVLDDGCGTGNLTFKLMTRTNHKISAIDPSTDAVTLTREKCCADYNKTIDIQLMNGEDLKYPDNTFDGISSVFVIPFVQNVNNYISEMFRTANPGGKIIISAWENKENLLTSLVYKMETELRGKGILHKYPREWQAFLQTSKINADKVIASDDTANLPLLLLNRGFEEIKVHKYNTHDAYDATMPYSGYASFITCQKPK